MVILLELQVTEGQFPIAKDLRLDVRKDNECVFVGADLELSQLPSID